MAANIAGLRRNIKNVAHNYTDAQVRKTFTHSDFNVYIFKLKINKTELVTFHNFCPSKFSKLGPDFHFFLNANLYTD